MYSNELNDYDGATVIKTKKRVVKRKPKEENDLFDETENDSAERNKFLSFDDEDEASEPFVNEEENVEEDEENDPLDEIIPYMDSIQEGIYEAKITSVKATKNDKVMVCFNLNIDNQFYYPLFAFFPKKSIKGNLTYLLLKAFDDKRTSFNSLIKKSIIVSVKIVKKNGKIYENLVDFFNEEYEISSLEVDKYGRFIF